MIFLRSLSSIGRVAGWGAVGGLLLSLLPAAMVGVGLATVREGLGVWRLTALIGALSLRTRGVYFIMITLAFAQMMFYLVNSMKAYGGDEGLTLPQRAQIGFGLDLGFLDRDGER